MEIRQIRYFLEIAQTEHLTQAAQQLFVTQSTLSHGLRQLEQELGVALFDRVGRGLRLSQAGWAFRTYAARALQEIEAGRMALADLGALQSGVLTVGVIPTFLHTLVPSAVAAFSAAYPGVSVVVRELRAGPIEEQLVEGQLDVGLAFYPTERPDIDTEPLFEERMQLVVNRAHPLAGVRMLPLQALAELPLAMLPRAFTTRRLIDACLEQAGVGVQVRVEMESVEGLIDVCRWGGLACIAPERAAQRAGDVCAIDLDSPAMVRHAGILWRKGASRSKASVEFATLLRQQVRHGSSNDPPHAS